MSLTIALEDEQGKQLDVVIDSRNLLFTLINKGDLTNSCCLRFVDPYGDTTFNRLQMTQFLLELASLHALVKSREQRELLSSIEDLGRRCGQEPHLYIKIYGD